MPELPDEVKDHVIDEVYTVLTGDHWQHTTQDVAQLIVERVAPVFAQHAEAQVELAWRAGGAMALQRAVVAWRTTLRRQDKAQPLVDLLLHRAGAYDRGEAKP